MEGIGAPVIAGIGAEGAPGAVGAAGAAELEETGLADAEEAESASLSMGGVEVLGSSSPTVLPSSPTTWTLKLPASPPFDEVGVGGAAEEMVIVVVDEAPSPEASFAAASGVAVGVDESLLLSVGVAVTVTVMVKVLVASLSSLAAEAVCEGVAVSLSPDVLDAEGSGTDAKRDDEGASPTALAAAAEDLDEGTKTKVTF